MIPAEARPLLDMISSGEASRYNELYGGGSFHDYADHPRIRFALANGKTTSAAGKYQFLEGTWDHQKAKLQLADFSPASQDEAAWDLARTTYQQKTGRDLLEDIRAGDTSRVRAALSGQWPSLGGGGGGYTGGGGRFASGGSTFGGFGSAAVKRPPLPNIKMVKLGREPGPTPKEPLPPVYKPPEPEEPPPLPKPARLPVLATGRGTDLAASFRAAIANLGRNRKV